MLAPAALGVVCAAARGIGGPLGRLLEWAPLVYLGKISYGLYVFHFFVPNMTARLFGWWGIAIQEVCGPFLFVLLNGLVLVVMCALSWHFFEKQINDLKRYVPYVPRDASPAARARTYAT
jgi:peptidoglycan/LPS O-acetylase OafA/YrhL